MCLEATMSDSANAFQELASSLEDRSATVAVVGMGYVGIPLAEALFDAGFQLLLFDTDERKANDLNQGVCYLEHLGVEVFEKLKQSGRCRASANEKDLAEADAHILCVPTPLGEHREPDLSYVVNSARMVGRNRKPTSLAVLESTTFPGTTRREFSLALEEGWAESGRAAVNPGLFVAYSPEREDPGRKSHRTKAIPKLVGGLDQESSSLALALYRAAFEEVVEVSSAEVAESAKLLENIFRAVNIALVNEMKVVLDELDIDIFEVVRAAATKPFGYMPFWPGPGLGGHCIPIDPFYMTWRAKEVGASVRFIELAGLVNTGMPERVISRVGLALNGAGQSVRGSRILILGLAYKADVGDTRESPTFELFERLVDLGADVDYSDPHVPEMVPVRKSDRRQAGVEISPSVLASYDCVLIATAHKCVRWNQVAEHARLVVDTRDVMRPWRNEMGERLFTA